MSNVLDALISRVSNLDASLANELSIEFKKIQSKREYGLVYEAHAPEGVRLWGKKITVGDVVHILPPRGMMEKKENYIEWKVVSIKNGMVHVVHKGDNDELVEQDVSVDDVVAYADFKQPIYPGFVEVDRIERGDKDAPYYVLINGENFHALQAMLWCYAGKVDCIYIDPPYNTGAKDWKYNNDYVDGNDQYRHSKWLSFMEQRLKLAKKLLNPKDSVLIVTIDEKEYLRLGMLLEQMFPEAQIQMVSSINAPAGTNRSNEFQRVNEYIYFIRFGDCLIEKLISTSSSSDGAEVYWKPLRRTSTNYRKNTSTQFYPIYINTFSNCIVDIGKPLKPSDSIISVPNMEDCETVFPIKDDGTEMMWALEPNEFKRRLSKGYIRVLRHTPNKCQKYSLSYAPKGTIDDIENNVAIVDGYRNDGSIIAHYIVGRKTLPSTQWSFSSHDAKNYGTGVITMFLPDRKFPFPKSLYAVEDCLRFFVVNKPNALIVDFFSGSGTTAHATMLLNHLDGGHRQCISITNNEVGPDNEKQFVKQGLRPMDKEWQSKGIAHYITWERIKAAITGIATNGEPIKGNYKFTEEFPMSDGFNENAIFFDLKYEDGKAVRLNMAFKEIAPLLWMKAGCKGRMIDKIDGKGYAVAEQYAILFDFTVANDFIAEIKNSAIKVAYIVTDSEPLYQQVYKQLPKGVEPVRLYENYLSSFAIYGTV